MSLMSDSHRVSVRTTEKGRKEMERGKEEERKEASRQRQQDGDTRTHLTFAQYQWEAVDVLARDLAEAKERLGEASRAKEMQEDRAQRMQAALFAIHATVCAVTAAEESAEDEAAVFCGIGVAVQEETVKLDGRFHKMVAVVGLKSDGPAARSGVMSKGDVILEIDDDPITGLGIARVKRMLTGPVNSEIKIKGRHMSKAAVLSPCLYEVTLLRSTDGGAAAGKRAPAKRTPGNATPLTPATSSSVTTEVVSTVHLESEKGTQQLREWNEYYLVEEASVEPKKLQRHVTELAQDVCDVFELLRAKTSGAQGDQYETWRQWNKVKAENRSQTSYISAAKTKLDEENEEGVCEGERKEFAEAVRNAAAAAAEDFEAQHNVLRKCKQHASNLQQKIESLQRKIEAPKANSSISSKSVLDSSYQITEQLKAELEAWASETELIREGWHSASQALCAQILLEEPLPSAPPESPSQKARRQHAPGYLKETPPQQEQPPHSTAETKRPATCVAAEDVSNLKGELVGKHQELKKARAKETEKKIALEQAIELENKIEKQHGRLQDMHLLEKMHTELQRATSHTQAEREQMESSSPEHKKVVEAKAQTKRALGLAIEGGNQSAKATAELQQVVNDIQDDLARALHKASSAEAQAVTLEDVIGKLTQSLAAKVKEHTEYLGELEKANADKKVLQDGLADKMREYMECLGKLEIADKDNRELEHRLAVMAEREGAAVQELSAQLAAAEEERMRVFADVGQMKVLLRDADADNERLRGEIEHEKSRESAARNDLEEVRRELQDMTERCQQAVEERDSEKGRLQQELEEARVEVQDTHTQMHETQTQLVEARRVRSVANTPHLQLVRMEKEVGKSIAREREARETQEEASAREKYQMAKMDIELEKVIAREREARDVLEMAKEKDKRNEAVKAGLMSELEILRKTLEETQAQLSEMKKALDQCVIELAESQHRRLAVQSEHEEAVGAEAKARDKIRLLQAQNDYLQSESTSHWLSEDAGTGKGKGGKDVEVETIGVAEGQSGGEGKEEKKRKEGGEEAKRWERDEWASEKEELKKMQAEKKMWDEERRVWARTKQDLENSLGKVTCRLQALQRVQEEREIKDKGETCHERHGGARARCDQRHEKKDPSPPESLDVRKGAENRGKGEEEVEAEGEQALTAWVETELAKHVQSQKKQIAPKSAPVHSHGVSATGEATGMSGVRDLDLQHVGWEVKENVEIGGGRGSGGSSASVNGGVAGDEDMALKLYSYFNQGARIASPRSPASGFGSGTHVNCKAARGDVGDKNTRFRGEEEAGISADVAGRYRVIERRSAASPPMATGVKTCIEMDLLEKQLSDIHDTTSLRYDAPQKSAGVKGAKGVKGVGLYISSSPGSDDSNNVRRWIDGVTPLSAQVRRISWQSTGSVLAAPVDTVLSSFEGSRNPSVRATSPTSISPSALGDTHTYWNGEKTSQPAAAVSSESLIAARLLTL